MLRQPRPLVPFTLGRVVPAPYWRRVLTTLPGALVGYWRLNETSGSVLFDASPNGFDGTYTGVTLNDTTFLDGEPAPRFTASSSYGNLYSSALAALYSTGAAFDEGSMMAWIKMDSARWTDGQARVIVEFGSGGSDKIYLVKPGANNTLGAFYARGSVVSATFSTSSTDWLHLLMTWSKANSYVRIYVDGAAGTQYSGALTTLGGGLASSRAVIGADSTVGTFAHIGNIKHVALWNQPITDSDDITTLAQAA